MSVAVHHVGQRVPSVEIVFIRTIFYVLFLVPWVLKTGILSLATPRWRLHLVRGLVGAAAVQCGFYAIANMPIADATAISFSRALFLTILAIIFLGEKVGIHRWSATLIGFLGIVIMLKPGSASLEVAALVGLGGAALVAALNILVRMLSSTERNEQIMLYSALINVAVSAPFAFALWVSPTPMEVLMLFGAAATGFVGQWSMIEGFRAGEASALAPISYIRLIFALILGYFLFGQVPSVHMMAGAAIVVAAALYTMHRESVINQRGAAKRD